MWGVYVILFGVWATILVGYDMCFSRLPNVLTYGGFVVTTALALFTNPMFLFGGVAWTGLYAVLGKSRGGVGGGDIKLAASLGIVAATAGWWGWWGAVVGASISTALVMVLLKRTRLPHGPGMIMAVAAVVLWRHCFP